MNRSDFSYTYTTKGYMIQFRRKNIGGAGTINAPKHWKHQQANLQMYRQNAEREINAILAGRGRSDIIKSLNMD